jgi:hypothetical protein
MYQLIIAIIPGEKKLTDMINDSNMVAHNQHFIRLHGEEFHDVYNIIIIFFKEHIFEVMSFV